MSITLKRDRMMTRREFERSLTGLLREVPNVRNAHEGPGFGQGGVDVVMTGTDSPRSLGRRPS